MEQAARQEAERVKRMKARPSGTHTEETIIAAEGYALELDALMVAVRQQLTATEEATA